MTTVIFKHFGLKFIYSEKAAKFCEIFPLLLTTVHTVKSRGKILQNFVAFSEYMNFNPKYEVWFCQTYEDLRKLFLNSKHNWIICVNLHKSEEYQLSYFGLIDKKKLIWHRTTCTGHWLVASRKKHCPGRHHISISINSYFDP